MWEHPLSSPTGNFCGTHGRFVVFSPLSHGLWLSLVERLNGVQEVPGSNPGSPISSRKVDVVFQPRGPRLAEQLQQVPSLGKRRAATDQHNESGVGMFSG